MSGMDAGEGARPAFALRPVGAVAGVLTLVLLALASRYGYHRDELYFIDIGGHPAFGYVDQPPLVPLLAHALDVVGGHSLVVLRLPAAVAAGLVVLVTGAIAREFGGGARAQTFAALMMAISSVTLAVGHLASTSVYDLLAEATLAWLIVRALRDGGRSWLLVGLVAGVALEIKTLPVFLLFAVLVGVVAVGPRDALRDRWLYAGALVAAALWAPNVIWEATHGWPQFELSRAIASGKSGSSQPRAAFLPFQALMTGPPLTPVWVVGLVQLWRSAALRTWRGLAVAWPVLVVVFIATGGKPYYLAATYPVLYAAGAAPTLRWMAGVRWRRRLVGITFAISLVISATITLPLVPVGALHDTPVLALNYDAGEQVGWPRFAGTVRAAWSAAGPDAVVLTHNYGEAGAIARYAADVPVYGTQNSMWDLGPPPAADRTVVAVGYDASDLRQWFGSVRQVATIDDGVHLDNDEQGNPVYLCTGMRETWRALWPRLRHLD